LKGFLKGIAGREKGRRAFGERPANQTNTMSVSPKVIYMESREVKLQVTLKRGAPPTGFGDGCCYQSISKDFFFFLFFFH